MNNKSLISLVIASSLAACGGGDHDEINNNTRGNIEIIGSDFYAGAELSAVATDADGILADTITYVWSTGVTGTSITITEADEGSPISVSARYTDEAGFTEGVGASTEDIKPTFNVSASIVKGPVEGATCEIFEVNANGEAVLPLQADAPSDASGNVTFTNAHIANNGLLSCTGGTYIDESTGSTLDAPQLRSVVKVVEDGGVATDEDGEDILDADGNKVILPPPVYVVSPLTEIAVQNTEADFNNFDEVAEDINARFGIRFDTTEVAPTVVGTDALGADGAEESDRYGSVLALISQLDADNADADISTVISDLSSDIADGDFADSLDSFETAQLNLETTSVVASSVDSSLLSIIGASVGYNNEPVTAIIEGELSGVVRNTAAEALTGTLSIIDPNFDEDSFIEQSDVALTYGTFSISASGGWTYTVNTENEETAALEVGASVSDSVTIASADGTTAEITIRVAALTQVVEIKNTGGDTGEIRFDVPNLRQGKLSASILKETAVGSDGNSKDAYIRVSGSSGTNSESLIDLRIQGDQTDSTGTNIAPRFLVRNSDNSAYTGGILTADFVENEFHDIEITWDLDATEQITVTFNGEVLFGGSFSTTAVVDSDYVNLDTFFAEGIEEIQFRFGDDGNTIPFASYFIDNIEVFSDTAGTTSVFSDDLESRELGETLSIVSDGEETYGQDVYAEVAVFDAGDGTVEQTPAVFFDLIASIDSDETTPLTGTVTVQDINDGEATIVEATVNGTYGDLSILADGSWAYTLDTANVTIAALVVGERETDTFTIESFDGTTTDLVITIRGTIVVNTGSDKAVRITDSSDADAGELRFKPSAPIIKGRMTATVRREVGAKAESPSEDAQIGLFGTSTSSNNAMAYIQLDISGDDYDLRDASGSSSGAGSTPGFTEGNDIDFEISWDATNATDTVAPLLTVTIDGQTAFNGEFSAPSADLPGLTDGLKTIFFRVGGTSDVSAFGFIVDDFVVYSSDSGAEIAVHTDDFENYIVGNSLDPNADTASTAPIAGAIVEAGTPYNDSSFEAFVVETGTTSNKFAIITDSSDADAGELRFKPSNPIVKGRMTATVKREAGAKAESPSEDAQIGLFGTSTSSNNAMAYIQLDISGDDFDLRDSSGSSSGAGSSTGFQEGVDIDFEISWDATNATDTVAPLLTVTIDGQTAFNGEFSAPSADLPGLTDGLKTIFFRVGGTSDVSAFGFIVDDFVVYSSDSGTEIAVHTDDFEGYTVGNSLDPNADTASTAPIAGAIVEAGTPYNNSSFEVVVGEN